VAVVVRGEMMLPFGDFPAPVDFWFFGLEGKSKLEYSLEPAVKTQARFSNAMQRRTRPKKSKLVC
jgi:hypothetical protein